MLDHSHLWEYIPPGEDLHPYFDRSRCTQAIQRKNGLVHIHQPFCYVMATFRLADSLPRHLIDYLKKQREQLMASVQADSKTNSQANNDKPWKILVDSINRKIDQGGGECWLKENACRKIFLDELAAFHRSELILEDIVIMPNHVHFLAFLLDGRTLWEILEIVRARSAHKINSHLHRQGPFWADGLWDTLIRDETHHRRAIDYIRNNPRGLPRGSFTYRPGHNR